MRRNLHKRKYSFAWEWRNEQFEKNLFKKEKIKKIKIKS